MMMKYCCCLLTMLFFLVQIAQTNAQDTTMSKDNKSLYTIKVDGEEKWGFYSQALKKPLSPAKYDTIIKYCCKNKPFDYYRVLLDEKGGTFELKNEILTAMSGIALFSGGRQLGNKILMENGIYKVPVNDSVANYGFYDPVSEDIKSEAIYSSLEFVTLEHLQTEEDTKKQKGFYIAEKQGKYGIFDEKQTKQVDLVFDRFFYDYRAEPPRINARKDKKWGIFSTDGKEVIPAVYDFIETDGFNYRVEQGKKVGILASDGSALIPVCYENIYEHANLNNSLVQKDGKWTVFSWLDEASRCNPKAELMYDAVGYFGEYYMVQRGGKYGLVDENAKEILPLEYQKIDAFYQRFLSTLIVTQNNQVGLVRIDSNKQVITEVPIEYDTIWVEEQNLKLKVRKGNKTDYYFEDAPYFDMQYTDVYYYDNINAFAIKEGTKWGLALESRKVVIQPAYSKLHVLDRQNFMVQKGKKWGIIGWNNQVKIPIAYDHFEYSPNWKVFFIRKGKKWGIASALRGVMLDTKYDDVVILSRSMYLVQNNGLFGVVKRGRLVVPIEYKGGKMKKDHNGRPYLDMKHPTNPAPRKVFIE